MTRSIQLLGVRVDDITMEETIARIAAYVAAGEPHQIVTVNPEFVMAAQHNRAFAAALAQADLAVPDGAGLALAGRWTGQPLRARVPGVELVEQIAAQSARHGWRIFFLGAAPGIAERTAATLEQRFPGMVVAGCYAGAPDPAHDAKVVHIVRAANPQILLVAYGAPAQDLWIARNQPALRVPVAIGVGGTFDYLSGNVPRAPRWMRRAGLEWLYRLVRQPWRWRRIWTAVVRFPLAIWWQR